MPRSIPSALLTYLARPITDLAECFLLTRPDGTKYGTTTHSDQLTFGGVTYTPVNGSNSGKADMQIGTVVSTTELTGAINSSAITEADIRAGKFRGSTLQHILVSPADTSNPYVLQAGVLGEISLKSGQFVAEFRSKMQLATQKIGSALSPTCRNEFCDAKCTLTLATYRNLRTVSAINQSATGSTASAVIQINCGGSISGSWVADTDSTGSYSSSSTAHAITKTGLINPAPDAVYQTQRGTSGSANNFTYTIPSLTAGQTYKVRLHFCEIYDTSSAGQRFFNVSLQGTLIINRLDVYNYAGGPYIAQIIEGYSIADASGNLAIYFKSTNDSPDPAPTICGIEVYTVAIPDISGNGIKFSGDSNPSGYYTEGIIQCVSGANAGVPPTRIKQHIKSGTSAIIVPQTPFPNAISVGDTFYLTRGCNKMPETCNYVFNNILNFNGERNLPTSTLIMEQGRG